MVAVADTIKHTKRAIGDGQYSLYLGMKIIKVLYENHDIQVTS